MNCTCGSKMHYYEGEDEFSTNELHWFAQWTCDSCGRVIRDFEEDFSFPEDVKELVHG